GIAKDNRITPDRNRGRLGQDVNVVDTGELHSATRAGTEEDAAWPRAVRCGKIRHDVGILPKHIYLAILADDNFQRNPSQLAAGIFGPTVGDEAIRSTIIGIRRIKTASKGSRNQRRRVVRVVMRLSVWKNDAGHGHLGD